MKSVELRIENDEYRRFDTACIKLILGLAFLVLLVSCGGQEKKLSTRGRLVLSAKIGGIDFPGDTTPTIHVVTTLFNPTNDTLEFVTMSCSYEDLFLTDTVAIKIASASICFSNFPISFRIPPQSKLDQFIIIRPANKSIKFWNLKTRIGMYYLIPKHEHGFDGLVKQFENRYRSNILWSEPIDIARFSRKVYK